MLLLTLSATTRSKLPLLLKSPESEESPPFPDGRVVVVVVALVVVVVAPVVVVVVPAPTLTTPSINPKWSWQR
jgi:hypothetical protein